MAGPAKTGAKKNTSSQRVRRFDGKVVRAVLYNGHSIGGPKLIAGEVDGELILGEDGWPLPLRAVGTLERA